MSVVEVLREYSEVWKLFGEMPDSATVNSELASVFLGISIKTLARYRQNGGGPPYIQYQAEDTKARNQRVLYVLGDLRAWRDIHKVSSSMHGAQVRGLTFTSLKDLTIPMPFWVKSESTEIKTLSRENHNSSSQIVIGHCLQVEDDSFKIFLRDHKYTIEWDSFENIIQRNWYFAENFYSFYQAFITVINKKVANVKNNYDLHYIKNSI